MLTWEDGPHGMWCSIEFKLAHALLSFVFMLAALASHQGTSLPMHVHLHMLVDIRCS